MEYLTTEEVAQKLRTPAETVRYWRHVGKGPKSFKIGRRVLYAVETGPGIWRCLRETLNAESVLPE